MFSYFVRALPQHGKKQTKDAEILSCHIYDMISVLKKCQILFCTVVTTILKLHC